MIQTVQMERLKELEGINSFIRNADSTITMILQSINWSRNHIEDSKQFVSCKFDSRHKVPIEKIPQHSETCKLRCDGYKSDEILLSDQFSNGPGSVTIDACQIRRIIESAQELDPAFKKGVRDDYEIPQSSSRLSSAYTADERKAIYDYAITMTPKRGGLIDDPLLSLESQSSTEATETPKSIKELLALSRDLKRRRAKYKVSTKSKSYTHVLREVIENQMSMYEDWITSKNANQKIAMGKTKSSNVFSTSDDFSVSNQTITHEKIYDSKRYDNYGDGYKHHRRDKYDYFYTKDKNSKETNRNNKAEITEIKMNTPHRIRSPYFAKDKKC